MRIKEVGYIVERLADRFRDLGGQMAGQEAAHKAALTEIRASFNARTSADGKIIAGLRVQVQDMRAEMERLRAQMSEQEVSVVGIINERNETWERFWAEVARLKSQTPKHPVKVGEWVRRTDAECDGIYFGRGVIAQVLAIFDAPEQQYTVSRPEWNGYTVPWAMQYCEPCDPPEATHDTEAGKAAAESGLLLNGGLDVRKVTT